MPTRRFFSVQLLCCLLLVLLCPVVRGQDILRCKPSETLSHFAKRLLPHGTVLAFPVREVSLGSFGHAFVLLFGETPKNYDEGWVLTPLASTPGQYRRYILPATDDINLSAVASPSFQTKSVFSAPLRSGDAPSLLIVFLVKGTSAVKEDGGRDEEQEYVTGVYRWTGRGFVFDASSDRLAGLPEEKLIRRRLHTLAVRHVQQR